MELSTQACNDHSPASPNTQYLKKKFHLDSIWTLGCNRFKKVLSKAHEWDQLNLTCMNIHTCGEKVHDLIVVDAANGLWTWANSTIIHYILWYTIVTTIAFVYNDHPLLFKSWFREYKRLSNPTWWWITKLSLIGSCVKISLTTFFGSHLQLYLQHIFTTSANSVSSYSSKGLLYCIVVPLPFWAWIKLFFVFANFFEKWFIICAKILINLKIDVFKIFESQTLHDNDFIDKKILFIILYIIITLSKISELKKPGAEIKVSK
jgi:hypothetical protein